MSNEKHRIIEEIKRILSRKDEVIFAYLHGSFTEGSFRDIDIAVYVDENRINNPLEYEITLSIEIERSVNLPIDVRVLNHAPMHFQYRVIKGELLVSSDDEFRYRFIENLLIEYLDFKPFEDKIIHDILASQDS